jgi:hypothetical protein
MTDEAQVWIVGVGSAVVFFVLMAAIGADLRRGLGFLPLNKEHPRAEQFEYAIKEYRKDCDQKWPGEGGVEVGALALVSLLAGVLLPFQGWYKTSLAALLLSFFLIFLLWLQALSVKGDFRDFQSKKQIILEYPLEVGRRIENFLGNGPIPLLPEGEFKLPYMDRIRPDQLRWVFTKYCELEELSTEEIKERLEKAGVWGVWNRFNPQYKKGRSYDEALMLVIYTARPEKREVEYEVASEQRLFTAQDAQAATKLEGRKELERRGEGLEQELQRLTGDRKERVVRLPAFSGQCVICSVNGEIEQLVLKVEAGDYSVRLEDVRKDSGETRRARVRNDGDPFTLGDWGDVFTLDDTELVVKKRGIDREERKPLW